MNGGRYSHDSYYNSRPPSAMYASRPDGGGSQYDLRQGGPGPRDYYDPHGNSYTPPSQMQGRRGYPRTVTEPNFPAPYQQRPSPSDYPIPNNHRSYETVASGSGSGSSADPAGYQTDPTSDNSSMERVQATAKPQQPQQPQQPGNDYGIGFSQTGSYKVSVGDAGNGPSNGYQAGGSKLQQGSAPPPVPQKAPVAMQRQPTVTSQAQQRPSPPEKRKSWFTRRFSKQG